MPGVSWGIAAFGGRAILLASGLLLVTACRGDGEVGTETGSAADEAIVAGSVEIAVLGEPYLGPLDFVPPVDCVVPVHESVVKDGRAAELSYDLEFDNEGDHVVVSWNDMRILEVDGEEVREEEAALAVAAFRLPSIVVDGDGAAVEVRGMQEMIDSIVRLDPRLAQLTSNPAFASLVEESVLSKYWDAWVGAWAEWGSVDDVTEEGYLDDGSAEPLTFVVTSVGTTDDGLAVLRRESSLTGDQLAAAMESVVSSVAPSDSGKDRDEFDGRVDDTIEIVTHPATLRPTSVLYQRESELLVDGETGTRVERRVARMEWDDAACS